MRCRPGSAALVALAPLSSCATQSIAGRARMTATIRRDGQDVPLTGRRRTAELHGVGDRGKPLCYGAPVT